MLLSRQVIVPVDKIFLRIVTKKIELAKKKDKHGWAIGTFQAIRDLPADLHGEVGELFVAELLRQMKKEIKHPQTTDSVEKHWDLMEGDTSLEIKTATLGTSTSTFQHENLEKDRRCDGIVFVDIAPNDLFITCQPKHTIDWRTLHHRRTGISYKWDFSLKKVQHNKVRMLEDFASIYAAMIAEITEYKQKKRRSSSK